MDTHIQVHMLAGLGNQMLGLAAACGVARANGATWSAIDQVWIHKSPVGKHPQSYTDAGFWPGVSFQPDLRGTPIRLDLEMPLLPPGNYVLAHTNAPRWRQCRHWTHCAEEVRGLFKLPEVTFPQSGKPLCAVHFRGGDFYQPNSRHCIVTPGYYSTVMGQLAEEYDFVLVTDDMERAIQCGLGHLARFKGESDLHDMAFIASCSAAIIANSSFAWWGAFLGDLKVCHYMVLDLSQTFQDTSLVAPTWTRHRP